MAQPKARLQNRPPHVGPTGSDARVVTLDIETAPLESYHWGLFDQNIGLEQIRVEGSILSYSAKWLGRKPVEFRHTGGRGIKRVRDDKPLVRELWKVLDAADIVVAQNGREFDLKWINARMVTHGIAPYSPVRVIDTMLEARKHFRFTSNKLAWTSKHLTVVKKSEHKKFPGFELWAECLRDNPKAWAEMQKYNGRDVIATEQLYLRLRPWITGHPNLATYLSPGDHRCPRCTSTKLLSNGLRTNQYGRYRRYQCQDCGGWAYSRTPENTTSTRKRLLGT